MNANAQPAARLGTHTVCQVCIVVDDAEAYAERYSRFFGVPAPEPMEVGGDKDSIYRGQPADAKARIYIWNVGDVQIELLQPIGPGSVWHEYLEANGPGVQHIAFYVKGGEDVALGFEQAGYPVTMKGYFAGRFANGGHTGGYHYLDTQKDFGTVFELLEPFDPNGDPR